MSTYTVCLHGRLVLQGLGCGCDERKAACTCAPPHGAPWSEHAKGCEVRDRVDRAEGRA